MGFGRVPTPAKYVLLVHMNMLQGLKIHQGLKIRHVYIHKHFRYSSLNIEPRSLIWLGGRLPV